MGGILVSPNRYLAKSADAVEYTVCNSAEG